MLTRSLCRLLSVVLVFYRCLLVCKVNIAVAQNAILTTLSKLDQAKVSNKTKRVSHIDVLEEGIYDDQYDGNNSTIGICNIVEMNQYSLVSEETNERYTVDISIAWHGLSAIALALEHLNTGDGTVVPEVEGLNKRCNIRFTADFIDTAGLESQALDSVVDVVSSNHPPCAFIGAFRSQVSIPTAILTGLKGYPQVSALSGSPKLNDKTQYPLFSRVIPSNDESGKPLLQLYYHHLNVRHLAVVYTDNTVGLSYVSGIRNAQALNYPDMTINTIAFPDQATPDDYSATVGALKQTGFRFFFAVARESQLEELTREAYKQGIIGTGVHHWMISSLAALENMFDGKSFGADDPMGKIGMGLTVFYRVGSRPGIGRHDAFFEEWSKLGKSATDLKYLQTKIPLHPNDPTYTPTIDPSMFEEINPFATGLYDAAILLGLSACRLPGFFFSGADHYKYLLNTSFSGVTGRIQLDPATGSRIVSNVLHSVVGAIPDKTSKDGNITFHNFENALFSGGEWQIQEPFVFNDGTTNVPPDLPKISLDNSYIGHTLRAVGLSMSCIIIFCSAVCSIWTYVNRSTRVVLASQPTFLHLLCVGTTCMGSALIPFSFDEEIAVNLDFTCRLTPWLWCLGWCIAFSALFTKTMRVNRIFHQPSFHRITVKASDVARPLAALMLINVVVLMLWTVLDPLTWKRTITSIDRFGRPSETTGACSSHNPVPYILPLIAVNAGVVVLAVYHTYVARNISVEFAESDFIGRAMSLILVVAAIALPTAIIAKGNTRANFFVWSGFNLVSCLSLLGFIFVPKVIYHLTGGLKQSSRDVVNASIQRLREGSSGGCGVGYTSNSIRRVQFLNVAESHNTDSVSNLNFHNSSSGNSGLNIDVGVKQDKMEAVEEGCSLDHQDSIVDEIQPVKYEGSTGSNQPAIFLAASSADKEDSNTADSKPPVRGAPETARTTKMRRASFNSTNNRNSQEEQNRNSQEHNSPFRSTPEYRHLELQNSLLRAEVERLRRRMEHMNSTMLDMAAAEFSSDLELPRRFSAVHNSNG